MKKARITIVLFAILLLVAGCSSNKDKDTASQNGMGRYVENKIALPDGLDSKTTLKLKKKDGMPFLYAFNSDSTITGYQLSSEGTWNESTPDWLKSVTLPAKIGYQDILEDNNGNHYIYYKGDKAKATLLRSTDNGSLIEIELEGMNEYNSQMSYYQAPTLINLISADTIAAVYTNKFNIINAESLKIEKSIVDMNYSRTILSVTDQTVAVAQIDSNKDIICIDLYDTSNNYKRTSFPFQPAVSTADFSNHSWLVTGDSYLDINEDKDLILCNKDGVHVLEQGTTLWQTVIDGSLNSLSMFTLQKLGFMEASNKNYYVLYQSNNDLSYSLMEYSYDKTVAAVPSTELNLYALTDNFTLRYAITVFQQTHPDVKINFNVAMTEDEYNSADTSIKEDYIRALNTELLAGGGPDLILLNDLSADDFIDKGILADMSDMIKPLVDSEELFPNIMNNYCLDGKYYQIPIRFSLPLLYARTDAKNFQTLSELAKFASENRTTTLFGELTMDDLYNNFSPYLKDAILGDDNNIDRNKLVQVLNELKAIADNCGIVSNYKEVVGRDNIGVFEINDLACHMQICISPCTGYVDAIAPLGIISRIKGSYVSFENSFLPKCVLGINKASKEQALCKEFISTILSEEVMRIDCYDGFPINKKALTRASQQSDSLIYGTRTYVANADGDYTYIDLFNLTTTQKKDLLDLCSSVTKKAYDDDQIRAAFKECTAELFQGSQTVEETADRIIEKTSVYLSE